MLRLGVYLLLLLACSPSNSSLGTLELHIDEEQPAGTIIGDISAGLPPDSTGHMFFISAQEGSGVTSDLEIDEHTGIIKTARVLDREQRNHYSFIAVTPEGITVEVDIHVDDINDHTPTFAKGHIEIGIPEHTPQGTSYPLEPAVDLDSGALGTQGYLIKSGDPMQAFRLETRQMSSGILSVELVVNSDLDRENSSSYSLTLEAYDGGSPSRSSQMRLDISILDINDHPPVFNQSRYQALISESLLPGSSVLQVYATDSDLGQNGDITYEINRRQSDPEGFFTINPHSGLIQLSKPLDYETRKTHELVVQARDGAAQPEVGTAFVSIQLRDSNDNQPSMTIIFLSEDGAPRVSEGANPGQYVARISVSDPDYGEHPDVDVTLEGGEGKFALTTKDSIIYLICVDKLLDREERDSYRLRVLATDSGTPPLRAESSFVLEVTDINDNPPVFDRQEYSHSVPEAVHPGSFLLQVTARDKDQGQNGEIRYSLLDTPWFHIHPDTGVITTAAPLDYEKDPKPQITVVASDLGTPPLTATAIVRVHLLDVNDNEPIFANAIYNATLSEGSARGSCFLKVSASDADSGSLGSVLYSLSPTSPPQFQIHSDTGEICLSDTLDRDDGERFFLLHVTATDGGGLSSGCLVRVSVEDVNDNRPVFYPLEYGASVSAHSPPGTPIISVTARDKDDGLHGVLTYHILSGNNPPLLRIEPDTGTLLVARSLSARAGSVLHLEVGAQDGGGVRAEVNAWVNISILPSSAHIPTFLQPQYDFVVPEDTPPGTIVGSVKATNPPGAPGVILYSLAYGDPGGLLSLDPHSGVLSTHRQLDREQDTELLLEVQAQSGSPPAYTRARVTLRITDVNDNPPTFMSSSHTLRIQASTPIDSIIFTAKAQDLDVGANGQIHYQLVPQGPFSIDSSGQIQITGPLNQESYDLRVLALDGGFPQLSSELEITVLVIEQESEPACGASDYRVEVREGSPPMSRLLQVQALLPGGKENPLRYRLRTDADAVGFSVEPETGWLYVRGALDRESREVYVLAVLASGGTGGRTATCTVRVRVTDENDNAPRLSEERYFMSISENRPPGEIVGRVSATDRDAGQNGRVTYRLPAQETDFTIHPHTGELSVRRSLDRENQATYQLLVIAQDGGAPPRSVTGTIHVSVLDENDNHPVFLHPSPGRETTVQVMEGKLSGAFVASILAKDADEGENGTVTYILSGPWAERFSLHPHTGELRTATSIHHAERSLYTMTVQAQDTGSPPKSTEATLRIQVLPSARHPTKPNPSALVLTPIEGLPPGSLLGSISPKTPHGSAIYTLMDDPNGTFMVDGRTGNIFLVKELDFESQPRYSLRVNVEEAREVTGVYLPPRIVQVDIEVQDKNDHSPVFPEDPLTLVVAEDAQVGSSVFTFEALDRDGPGPNSQLRYSLLRQEPESAESIFRLDAETGVMSIAHALDREKVSSYLLMVEARDCALNASQRRSTSVTARIFLSDRNDNTPQFITPSVVWLSEDLPVGSTALFLVAQDPDLGENGRIGYQLVAGNEEGRFQIHPSTGALSVVRGLDREETAGYNLTLVAMDYGSPRLSSTQTLSVSVLDVNDDVPTFEKAQYEGHVKENQAAGTTVLRLQAMDRDLGPGGQVTYGGGTSEEFSLHPQSGILTTKKPLDREKKDVYKLTAYARDGGSPPKVSEVRIHITVGDENDNAPVFESNSIFLEVPENQEPITLCVLRAWDLDTGSNGQLKYRLIDGDQLQDFSLDSSTGVLSTTKPLDRESVSEYGMTILVQDSGNPPLSASTTITISVLDLNDNTPTFSEPSFHAEVAEDAPVGSLVLRLTALDPDYGHNGRTTFHLSNGTQGAFHIDPLTGHITTAIQLDRERRAAYTFLAWVMDSDPSGPRSAETSVTVIVKDVNDNPPTFLRSPFHLNLSRNTPIKRTLAAMRAEDKDAGANASILYRLAPHSGTGRFSVDPYTGEVRLLEPLDGMSPRERTVFVQASDLGEPPLSSTAVLVIHVREEAARGPRFPREANEFSLSENSQQGSVVGSVKAAHSGGSSGKITYSILSGNEIGAFSISPNTGQITVLQPTLLDFEANPRHKLVIQAETTQHYAFTAVTILLQDANDNTPRFQLPSYTAYIREGLAGGSLLIQVLAEDPDQGMNGQITYTFEQFQPMRDLFRIDPQSGVVTTAVILDREIWSEARLVVTATDRGSPPLTGSATLTLIVMDVNDNSPTIPLQLELSIPEDALIGSEIAHVTANDVDSGPPLWYILTIDGSPGSTFSIFRYGGQIWLTEPLDYEERASYTLTIQTSDGKHQTRADVRLTLQDVNDNAPEFKQNLYQVIIMEHTPAWTPLLTITATDRDSGEMGRVTYKVLSSGTGTFHIDPHNGTLFTKHPIELDTSQPLVDVLVEARDQGSPSLTSFVTVQILVTDVNDHVPTFPQQQYTAAIPEDLPLGSTILILEATDADLTPENSVLDYTILSGNVGNVFQVQSSLRFWNGQFQQIGSIILTDALDFETMHSYNLTLGASDRGVPQRSHSVHVLITVLDVNDNPPVFPRPDYSVLLSEAAPVGSEVLRVLAQDSDSGQNGLVHYRITSGDESRLFQINEASGAIKLVRQLDRERQAVHTLVVLAFDGNSGLVNFALAPVKVEVRDINDNKPYFPVQILTTSIKENQPANTLLTIIHAIDLDTGMFGHLLYTVLELPAPELGLPNGKDVFSVNRTSGELLSRQSFDYERSKAFNMIVKATDAGNFSATVTVQVLVTGEDEYDPVFVAPYFNFEVPEGASKGQTIGRVQATDEDEGADGVVLYSFSKPSPYFGINETTGQVYLKVDSQRHRSGRSKRETREMMMEVHAHSPLPSSRVAMAQLTVDITHTSFGLAPDLNLLLIVSVASSLAVVVVLAAVAIILVVCRSRGMHKKSDEADAQLDNLQGSTLQRMGHDKSTLGSGDRIYHQTLPGYSMESSTVDGSYTRGGSIDPSHSSGRGSAEAAEDDEIRMINEYPRVASITSSMQEHISARGPDSGIQQDADQLSDISCDPSMDSGQWFKNKKGSGQSTLYRDDSGGGGAFMGVGCGLNMSHPKDYSFPEDGKPSVEGSLTAIVASDEELRGSYNWDYLLNWCPQFQPLASVFMEIARLKDESALRKPFQPKPKAIPQPRIDPPPLITSVAHPGAKTVPPKPAVGRTFPNFSSLRRSPITHEASLSSSIIPPSFSPSLSPLAARSPVVSPFGISQGPSASVLSTEHNLDPSGDGELRI
ncbi:protocadherin-16 [Hyla sarda]|nr:protocadherin-16 [Hyla sarda]XP_056408916.1 protocadherin-16 [Hyla sarda]XP_056408917.1 protocadherin-16 [Hyla sarda]XP_056408918.1 protocadherin-16 [Hyla sarda]